MQVTVTGRDGAGYTSVATVSASVGTSVGGPPALSSVGVPEGTVLTPWTDSLTLNDDGATYEDVDFGGYLRINARDVTLRRCKYHGAAVLGEGGYLFERCTSTGNTNFNSYYKPMDGVTLYGFLADITDSDGVDIFSTADYQISNVEIDGLICKGQTFPAGSAAHGDGMQIRGVTHMVARNMLLDMGPYQPQKNSGFYTEDVGDGINDLTLEDSELRGGGYTLYLSNAVGGGRVSNVAITQAGHWGSYYSADPTGWVFENVTSPSGALITP